MKRTAIVACVRELGDPGKVIHIEEWTLPELQPHQVLVNVLAAPINPADLNLLEGKYGYRPALPFVAGNEGVGVVREVGAGVKNLSVGQRVVGPGQLGWWCTARVLEESSVFPVPSDIPVELAAMLSVNPPAAYRMLMDFVPLNSGDWIVQNAANSAAGRFVIQIARQKGWRTVNVVRRKELITELNAIGADIVVTDDKPLSKQIGDLVKGAEIRLGLNAVGGESAREIAKSIARHGTLVTYGAMGREPLRIDNGMLIFKDIRVRGFWINEWFQQAPRSTSQEMLTELMQLAQDGKLKAPIERAYPLTQAQEAIAQASRSGRTGKILFLTENDKDRDRE